MRKNSTYAGPRIRVLIADDCLAFAERCRSMLEPEFEVVGIVQDGFRLAERACELKPGVVLIDMSMPDMTGFEAGERVNAATPGAKTIYMTVAADFRMAAEAFRRGASGFVDKTRFPEELRVAMRRAARGELQFSRTLLREEQDLGSFYLFTTGRGRPKRRPGLGGPYEAEKPKRGD